MPDLIYAITSSLDGYISDENGDFDWARPSDEVHRFFNDLQRSVGTFLCGRRMYETMRVWDSFRPRRPPRGRAGVRRGVAGDRQGRLLHHPGTEWCTP